MKIRPIRSIPMFFEGGTPDTVAKKDFDDLAKLVRGLTTVVQQQTVAMNQMRTQITTAPAPKGSTPPVDDDDADDDVDVNAMDNKGFAAFLMKNVGKILDTKVTELGSRLDNGLREVRTGRARDEIGKFASEHKDFKDWEIEIAALAKQHPSLGIQQLYTLARSSDPEKVKEVDAKYVEKKEEPNPEDERLTLFGGYRPSTGKTTSADGTEPKKLTTNEALEKSWDDAVAKFPALKSLGEDSLD